MNKKQIRPLPVKTLKKQPNKSRKKWLPIIILAALLIGYLVWKNSLPDANTSPIESTQRLPRKIALRNQILRP